MSMARVPYAEQAELPAEYRDLVVSSLQPGKTINVYRAVGNNPAVLAGLRTFLGSLWSESGLTDRERELVILATARAADSAYEWHHHVGIAKDAGVTEAEIRAINTGAFDGFDPADTAILEYTAAVVAGRITDEHHDELAAQFAAAAISGIAATAAGYLALARVIEALGVEIEDGVDFVGWNLENA